MIEEFLRDRKLVAVYTHEQRGPCLVAFLAEKLWADRAQVVQAIDEEEANRICRPDCRWFIACELQELFPRPPFVAGGFGLWGVSVEFPGGHTISGHCNAVHYECKPRIKPIAVFELLPSRQAVPLVTA